MLYIPPRVARRAARNVAMGPDGCHISTFATDKRGYALVRWTDQDDRRRSTYAHRAAWTDAQGAIPDGLTVDHQCRARRCVRIDHLRLLSVSDNSSRNWGRDYPLGQSCPRDHPPERRLKPSWHTGTLCLDCQNENHTERQRRWREANPEKVIEQRRRANLRRKAARSTPYP